MKELLLARLDQEIEDSRKLVKRGEALERLRKNKDFRELIIEDYLQNEAVRLVHYRGSATADTPALQAKTLRDLDAIGSFHQFLMTVQQMAAAGAKTLENAEDARQDILAEVDDNE